MSFRKSKPIKDEEVGSRARLAEILCPGVLLVNVWHEQDFWLIENKTLETKSGSSKLSFTLRNVKRPHEVKTYSFTDLIEKFSVKSVPDE